MSNAGGSDVGGWVCRWPVVGAPWVGWVGGLGRRWTASRLGGEIPKYTTNRGFQKLYPLLWPKHNQNGVFYFPFFLSYVEFDVDLTK
jgi:hypothetical protein